MKTSEAPVYFKLKWQLLAVTSCDVHRVRLHDACRACGAAQDRYGAHTHSHLCVRCSNPLDELIGADLAADSGTTPVRDLVAYVAAHPGVRFPPSGLSSVVAALHDQAWGREAEQALYRTMPRDAWVRFSSTSEAVSFRSALRISGYLDIPLVDLLSGQLNWTNRSLPLGLVGSLATYSSVERRRPKIDRDQLHQRLTVAMRLAQGEALPSLRRIARLVGVSVGALWYHFPGEVQELADTCTKVRSGYRQRRRVEAREAAQQRVAARAIEGGNLPGRKALLRELRDSTGLPKQLLRAEIHRAMSEMSHALRQNANGPAEANTLIEPRAADNERRRLS